MTELRILHWKLITPNSVFPEGTAGLNRGRLPGYVSGSYA